MTTTNTVRQTAVGLMALQAENVLRRFTSTGKIDHSVLGRLTQTLLRIKSLTRLEHEDRERLGMKLEAAGDENSITNLTDTGKLYLNGFYDPKALAKTVIW